MTICPRSDSFWDFEVMKNMYRNVSGYILFLHMNHQNWRVVSFALEHIFEILEVFS